MSVDESTSFVVDVQPAEPGSVDWKKHVNKRGRGTGAETTPEEVAESFVWFHNHNPHVLDELVKSGRSVQGNPDRINMFGYVYEDVRSNVNVRVQRRPGQFKLTAQYRKFYVRLINLRYPEFQWETRPERKGFDTDQFILDNLHRLV